MMPLDLVLVRHGQSEANLAKRRSEAGDHTAFTEAFKDRHSSSFRLTKLGREQAVYVGGWIKENLRNFDRYITSEYTRAMETAALMKLPRASWYRDVYLTERNWGDLDVCPENEREEKFGEALRRRIVQPFFWKPPNGESFLELCMRVDRVLHTLHRECSDKKVLVVCHGEVMRAFQVRLERMSQSRFKELTFSTKSEDRIHNCQIMHYTRRDPESGNLAKYANWVRFVRPAETELPSNDWQKWRKIIRCSYSNEDLIKAVSSEPAMIT